MINEKMNSVSDIDVDMNEFYNSPEFSEQYGSPADAIVEGGDDEIDEGALSALDTSLQSSPMGIVTDPKLSMSDQDQLREKTDLDVGKPLYEIMSAMNQQRYLGREHGLENSVGDHLMLELGFAHAKTPQARLGMLQQFYPQKDISLHPDQNTVTVVGKDKISRDFYLNTPGPSLQDVSDILPDVEAELITMGLGSKLKFIGKGSRFATKKARAVARTAADFMSGVTAEGIRQQAAPLYGVQEDGGFDYTSLGMEGLYSMVPGAAYELGKGAKKLASATLPIGSSDPLSIGLGQKMKSTGHEGLDTLLKTSPEYLDKLTGMLEDNVPEALKVLEHTKIPISPAQLLLGKASDLDYFVTSVGGASEDLWKMLKNQNEIGYYEMASHLKELSSNRTNKGLLVNAPVKRSRKDTVAAMEGIASAEGLAIKKRVDAVGERIGAVMNAEGNRNIKINLRPLYEGLLATKAKRASKSEAVDTIADALISRAIPEDMLKGVRKTQEAIAEKQGRIAELSSRGKRGASGSFYPDEATANQIGALTKEVETLEKSLGDQFNISLSELAERQTNVENYVPDMGSGLDISAVDRAKYAALSNPEWGIKAMQEKVAEELPVLRAEYRNLINERKRFDESPIGSFSNRSSQSASEMGGKIFKSDMETAQLQLDILKRHDKGVYDFVLADEVRKQLGMFTTTHQKGVVPDDFAVRIKNFLDSDSVARQNLTLDTGKAQFYNSLSTAVGAHQKSSGGYGGVGGEARDLIEGDQIIPVARGAGSTGQFLNVVDHITAAIKQGANKETREQLKQGFHRLLVSDAKGIPKLRMAISEGAKKVMRVQDIQRTLKMAFVLGGKMEIRSYRRQGEHTAPISAGAQYIQQGIGRIMGGGGLQP